MSSAQKYRPDIDGLRAIAVLAVVFFHAEIWPFSGGYVGVDIFFVISGFLITRIINGEMDRGQFSLIDFYHRRIRRLLPALFLMLGVTMLVGLFVLLPRDLDNLGRNAVGAALFVSNILLWMQVSYFEADAHLKPLLHIWSLAVEEQYYIAFPPLLLLLRRYWPQYLRPIVVLIAGASLVAAIWAMPRYPSAGFYLAPFRIWELMIGSIIALDIVPAIRDRKTAEYLSALGLAMISGAVFIYSELTLFPGMSALLPCTGAALLIYAGQNHSPFASRILAWQPLVGIGLISYSLYLWHWPLLVFSRYWYIDPLSLADSVMLVGVSVLLGWLSWRYVEMPFRKSWPSISKIKVFAITGGSMAVFCAMGSVLFLTNGLPERYPTAVREIAAYDKSFNPNADRCMNASIQLQPSSPCTIKANNEQQKVFLWGDSHAGALFGAFSDLAKSGVTTIYGVTPRCPPGLGIGTDRSCLIGNDRRLAYLEHHPEIQTVVIAARWTLYLDGRFVDIGTAETNSNLPYLIDRHGDRFAPLTDQARGGFRQGLQALTERLVKAGKRVVIVYPIPEFGADVPLTQARMLAQDIDPSTMVIDRAIFDARQRSATAMLDSLGKGNNIVRFYPANDLCDKRYCYASEHGRPLYFDSHHLSISGASYLHNQLAKAIGFVRSPSHVNLSRGAVTAGAAAK